MKSRTFFVSSLLVLAVLNVRAQTVSVSDSIEIPSNAGEAQSTVVPPGRKSQCKQGRFLVTDDQLTPPDGVVFGQNLDEPGGALLSSIFDMGGLSSNFSTDASKSNYYFGTNDHDLVVLSNGDVLYITGAFSRMPFNVRGGAGPNSNVPLDRIHANTMWAHPILTRTPEFTDLIVGPQKEVIHFTCPLKIQAGPANVPEGWQSLGNLFYERRSISVDVEQHLVVCWYGEGKPFPPYLIARPIPTGYVCTVLKPEDTSFVSSEAECRLSRRRR